MRPLAPLCACVAVAAALSLQLPAANADSGPLEKCESTTGKLTFSNTGAGSGSCQKSFPNRKKRPSSGSAKPSGTAPARQRNYPKVSRADQSKRDQTRLQILRDELHDEREAAARYDEQIQTAQLTDTELAVMRKILDNHILNIQALLQEIEAVK